MRSVSVSRSLQERIEIDLWLLFDCVFLQFIGILLLFWFLFSQNVALDLYCLVTKCSVQIWYLHCLLKMEAVEGCCVVKTCSLSWMLIFHLNSLRYYLYPPSHLWWISILHTKWCSLLDRIILSKSQHRREGRVRKIVYWIFVDFMLKSWTAFGDAFTNFWFYELRFPWTCSSSIISKLDLAWKTNMTHEPYLSIHSSGVSL